VESQVTPIISKLYQQGGAGEGQAPPTGEEADDQKDEL
jgi:hypothetical protein